MCCWCVALLIDEINLILLYLAPSCSDPDWESSAFFIFFSRRIGNHKCLVLQYLTSLDLFVNLYPRKQDEYQKFTNLLIQITIDETSKLHLKTIFMTMNRNNRRSKLTVLQTIAWTIHGLVRSPIFTKLFIYWVVCFSKIKVWSCSSENDLNWTKLYCPRRSGSLRSLCLPLD